MIGFIRGSFMIFAVSSLMLDFTSAILASTSASEALKSCWYLPWMILLKPMPAFT